MARPAGLAEGDLPPLVVLGATGSIGAQALEVAQDLGVRVAAVAAQRGSERLAAVADSHPEAVVAVAAPTSDERSAFAERFGDRVRFGAGAVVEVASLAGVTVLNGVVGATGLRASIAALETGNRLALANKESLVAGGPLVLAALKQGGGELIPVDSEHSALFQCLIGEGRGSIRKLILTASGGPFRGWSREQVEAATAAQALAHPTWSMGPRISIDSATLVNKGLEVIEAHFLFGLPYESIEVVVHPQSIVHSLVEFVDGSLKAQLGEPDMRIPIRYALTYPHRAARNLEPFSLTGKELTFVEPDRQAFPGLDLAYEAGRRGGNAPAVFNAADEVAVRAFLEGRLGFHGIPSVIEKTLAAVEWAAIGEIDDVLSADREARAVAGSLLGGSC